MLPAIARLIFIYVEKFLYYFLTDKTKNFFRSEKTRFFQPVTLKPATIQKIRLNNETIQKFKRFQKNENIVVERENISVEGENINVGGNGVTNGNGILYQNRH
jgi:hypothetical protein